MSILLMACMCSCNEDATTNDIPLSQTLIGSWQMNTNTSDQTASQTYRFTEHQFIWSTTSVSADAVSQRTWSVRGDWRIYKGVLECYYDLDTFTTLNYSETEAKDLKNALEKENLMLSDMRKKKHPYGLVVEFGTMNGKQVLYLNGVNGYFERLTY